MEICTELALQCTVGNASALIHGEVCCHHCRGCNPGQPPVCEKPSWHFVRLRLRTGLPSWGSPFALRSSIAHTLSPFPLCTNNQFINWRGYFLVMLQAVMDHQGCITHINVRWSDVGKFRSSLLSELMEQKVCS